MKSACAIAQEGCIGSYADKGGGKYPHKVEIVTAKAAMRKHGKVLMTLGALIFLIDIGAFAHWNNVVMAILGVLLMCFAVIPKWGRE